MDEIKDILMMMVVIEAIESTLAQNDPQYQLLQMTKSISAVLVTSAMVSTFTNQMQLLTLNRIYQKVLYCQQLANELYQYVTG